MLHSKKLSQKQTKNPCPHGMPIILATREVEDGGSRPALAKKLSEIPFQRGEKKKAVHGGTGLSS
jgi:hypothetical protein